MSSNDNGKLKGCKATKCPVSLWNCVVVYEHWVVFSSKCIAGPECDMIGSGQIQSKNKTFNLKCVHHQNKIHSDLKFWPWADATLSYFHEICKFQGITLQFFGLVV